MSKRTLTVGFLTAGLSVGVIASVISPAAAQGNTVSGEGNVYFLSGALNDTGVAQDILLFGNVNDEVYYGDWYDAGVDLPMVRRGNVYFVPDQYTPTRTAQVFTYGNVDDQVLVGDWNGDGVDSLAVRRDNRYLVKNDNLKSGVADSEFAYGDAGDTVLVGNWNGVASPASAGVDNSVPANNTFTDSGTPAYAADVDPAVDAGFDANGNGDFTDAGDRQPGTGVDNNKDGDFDDAASPGTPADVPPGPAKGDTLMIQRGNEFFVKNSITTGVADYTFVFGDRGDTVLVGDWATPAMPETATLSAKPAASGNDADQLAVRRGFTYYQSSELEVARTKKTNPTTTRVFAYGDATDTVFVSSLPSQATDQFGAPVTAEGPAYYAAGDTMYDANGTTTGTATASDAGTPKRDSTGALVTDPTATRVPVIVTGDGLGVRRAV